MLVSWASTAIKYPVGMKDARPIVTSNKKGPSICYAFPTIREVVRLAQLDPL